MAKGIIGKKLGMSQIYENEQMIPVTLIEAGPCVVTQVKTDVTDGYSAVQIGYDELPERKINKPMKGHFEKSGATPRRHLAELRLRDDEATAAFELGSEITVEAFEAGETVSVTGTSKGRGFSGVMKRHGFHGLGASHGTHRAHRKPGSIGASATPSRVFPGKKMAGQYGNERSTTLGLQVVRVDAERNVLAIKGAVPGSSGGVVFIKAAE